MYRDSESIPDGHWFLGTVIIACLLLTPCPGNAQSASAIKPAVTAMPLNFQLSTGPSMHTIESSNLDDDFSPGEATTNAPAELDEIYAPHKSYLGFTGIDRPLNLLANPLGANGAKISIAFVEDGGELHAFYDGVLSGMDKPWGGVSWLLARNG